MRLWYLSHRWPAKAQASLRILAVSPEPSLFAHINYGSRRRVQPTRVLRIWELEQTWKYISTQCCTSFHPCRSILKQIWPCHENSQGQPKVSIWNIVSTRAADAVYQVSKSSALWFWRKIFLKFFTIIHMGMVKWPGHLKNFHSPHLIEAPYEIWLQSG